MMSRALLSPVLSISRVRQELWCRWMKAGIFDVKKCAFVWLEEVLANAKVEILYRWRVVRSGGPVTARRGQSCDRRKLCPDQPWLCGRCGSRSAGCASGFYLLQ